jgi:hypothetical protein
LAAITMVILYFSIFHAMVIALIAHFFDIPFFGRQLGEWAARYWHE